MGSPCLFLQVDKLPVLTAEQLARAEADRARQQVLLKASEKTSSDKG